MTRSRAFVRPRPAALVAVAAVLSIAAGCASGDPSGAKPDGSAAPSAVGASTVVVVPSPSSTAFHSDRHGYSVTMPGRWSTNEPPGAGGVHPDEPGVDTFRNGGHVFYVTAETTTGQPSAWTCAIVQHLEGPDHGLTARTTGPLTVDGVPGRLSEFELLIKPYRIHYLEAEVVRAGRGYALSLESTTGDDAGDRAVLDGLIAGFSFDG